MGAFHRRLTAGSPGRSTASGLLPGFSILLPLLVAATITTGCAVRRTGLTSIPASPSSRAAEADSTRRVEALARFATGVSRELNNQPVEALAEFEKSAALDPANEVLQVELAERHLQLGRPDRAFELLSLAAKSPGVSADTLALLGRTALVVGQTNVALSASEASLKIAPTRLAPYQTLAEVHFRLGQPADSLRAIHRAAAQIDEGSAAYLVGVVDLYAKFLKLHPDQTDELKPRIRRLLAAALERDPDNSLLLSQIAGHYAAIGDVAESMQAYEELVGGLTNLPILRDAALEKLANYYLGHGEFEKAESHLEAIVRDNPTQFPQAYFFLGTIAAKNGRYEKAEDHLRRFLILNARFEPAYYELARAQVAQGRGEAALETLRTARERFPATFLGEFLAALAHSRNGDHADAVQRMVSAEIIARGGDGQQLNAGFYFQLGILHEKAKQIEDSIRSLRKSLELEPDDAEVLNFLGYLWAERGENLDEAHDLIDRAVAKEPDNAAFLDSLAWVLFKLGRPAEALPHMRRAVDLAEEPDPVLFDHLGDILAAVGQNAEARAAWEKSLALKPDPAIRAKLAPDVPPPVRSEP